MPERATNQRRESFSVYRQAVASLKAAGVPFLVGGAWGLRHWTGIERMSNDFDVFLRETDITRACRALEADGFTTEEDFSPHWLAKAISNRVTVDLIFGSGNGVAVVDDGWFAHAATAELFGMQVLYCPVEEMIWSKAFIMERERFDGAEIAHLIHQQATRIDWDRLLARFGPHWRVLLAHLVLFGFVYPSRRDLLPPGVLADLIARLEADRESTDDVCMGTILSRTQYVVDVSHWGYRDGRLPPTGEMQADHVEEWTERGLAEQRGEVPGDGADPRARP